jgi:hypothetical protein
MVRDRAVLAHDCSSLRTVFESTHAHNFQANWNTPLVSPHHNGRFSPCLAVGLAPPRRPLLRRGVHRG